MDGMTCTCSAAECRCDRPLVRLEDRQSVTEEASALVAGDRQAEYGDPLENHDRIAAFWNVRLRDKLKAPLEPHEVAACMRLVKESRLMQTRGHRDSLVDIAGYANVETRIHDAQAERGGGGNS